MHIDVAVAKGASKFGAHNGNMAIYTKSLYDADIRYGKRRENQT